MIKTNKYIGKYRILAERDLQTGKPINNGENTYISCYRNIQIHRVGNKILCLVAPFKVQRVFIQEKLKDINLVDFYRTDMETLIWFYEEDLEKILEVFPAKTKGKDIKPKNKFKSRVKLHNKLHKNRSNLND